MALILAIEPDRSQASKIAALVRDRLDSEFVAVDSAEKAVARLAERVPDLVLTPLLLSPDDDAALTDRLRELDAAGHYVQTLVIPLLVTGASERKKGGLFSRLRGGRGNKPATEGCDPEVFATQIAEYLERGAAERSARELAVQRTAQQAATRVEAPAAGDASATQAGTHPFEAPAAQSAGGGTPDWSDPWRIDGLGTDNAVQAEAARDTAPVTVDYAEATRAEEILPPADAVSEMEPIADHASHDGEEAISRHLLANLDSAFASGSSGESAEAIAPLIFAKPPDDLPDSSVVNVATSIDYLGADDHTAGSEQPRGAQGDDALPASWPSITTESASVGGVTDLGEVADILGHVDELVPLTTVAPHALAPADDEDLTGPTSEVDPHAELLSDINQNDWEEITLDEVDVVQETAIETLSVEAVDLAAFVAELEAATHLGPEAAASSASAPRQVSDPFAHDDLAGHVRVAAFPPAMTNQASSAASDPAPTANPFEIAEFFARTAPSHAHVDDTHDETVITVTAPPAIAETNHALDREAAGSAVETVSAVTAHEVRPAAEIQPADSTPGDFEVAEDPEPSVEPQAVEVAAPFPVPSIVEPVAPIEHLERPSPAQQATTRAASRESSFAEPELDEFVMAIEEFSEPQSEAQTPGNGVGKLSSAPAAEQAASKSRPSKVVASLPPRESVDDAPASLSVNAPPSGPSPAEWMDLLTSIKRDVAQLRMERAAPPPETPSVKTSGGGSRRKKKAREHAKPAKSARKMERSIPKKPVPTAPVQDEWGFFDPDQCGFNALLAKLDEITE
jgi:hypothetical protein